MALADKSDPIITKNGGAMVLSSHFDEDTSENLFVIEIDFTPQGETTTYKSIAKFFIDYDTNPPGAAISLIEAKPQRQGLGKLLMNMVAQMAKDLGLKNISTIMNTPEEKTFYSSVGLEVPQKELDRYKTSLEEEGVSAEDIVTELKQAKDRLNKSATAETVETKTNESVNTTLDEHAQKSLNFYLRDLSSNVKQQIIDKNNKKKWETQKIVQQLVLAPHQITAAQLKNLDRNLTTQEKERLKTSLAEARKNLEKPANAKSQESMQKKSRANPIISNFKSVVKVIKIIEEKTNQKKNKRTP